MNQYYNMFMNLLLLVSLCALCILSSAKKLIFVQCITRHGVRYPSYPNDYDYSNITETNMQNQLTVQGRQMLFFLGRTLYKKYWKTLFQGTKHQYHYDRSLIYAKSTNRNRTIESLQNLLAGLLTQVQPDKVLQGLKENQNILFKGSMSSSQLMDNHYQSWKKSHFVPIHVQKGAEGDPDVAYMRNEGDFMVKEELNLCPNQQKWAEDNLNSPFVLSLMKEQKITKAISKLQPYFSSLPLQFSTIFKYVDNYYCLKAMNKQYLEVFEDPEIKQYLDFLYIARLYGIYASTDIQIKTFSKTLMKTTINNMKQAISRQGPQMVFYSGHDITIAFMLAAMNFTNLPCLYQKYIKNESSEHCYYQYPGFGAAFIFELYQEDNSSYSIQVSINGQLYPIPLCNYSLSCPLETFQSWFTSFTIKQSPNEVCRVNTEGSYFYELPLCFALGMATAFFLFFLLSKKQKGGFSHSTIQSEEEVS